MRAPAGELVRAPLGREPAGAEQWAPLLEAAQAGESAGFRGVFVGIWSVSSLRWLLRWLGDGLGVVRWGTLGVSWSPPARPGPPIGSSSGVGNASLLRELSVPRARLPRRAPHRCSCWVRGIRGACQLLKRLASLGCMILFGLDFCRLIQILSASDRGGILGVCLWPARSGIFRLLCV